MAAVGSPPKGKGSFSKLSTGKKAAIGGVGVLGLYYLYKKYQASQAAAAATTAATTAAGTTAATPTDTGTTSGGYSGSGGGGGGGGLAGILSGLTSAIQGLQPVPGTGTQAGGPSTTSTTGTSGYNGPVDAQGNPTLAGLPGSLTIPSGGIPAGYTAAGTPGWMYPTPPTTSATTGTSPVYISNTPATGANLTPTQASQAASSGQLTPEAALQSETPASQETAAQRHAQEVANKSLRQSR